MIRRVENDKLLALLEDREELLQSIKDINWDDWELNRYNVFIRKYNNLTQLQKDLYILYIKIGSLETAQLMKVSQRFINYKIKEIKELLK